MRYTIIVLVVAFTVCTAAVLIVCNLTIVFETNDDVAMMMLAHGFGLTQQAGSLLPFSNRLQGEIISLIGTPFGEPGYSLYMFGCLAIGLGFLVASLSRLSGSLVLSVFVVAALSIRTLFTPQFTVVSSTLTMAAVVVFLDDRGPNANLRLLPASILAFLGMMMRLEAAVYVILLASPMVFQRSLFRRPVWFAGGVTLAAAALALWWDRLSYGTPEWATYNAVEGVRAWFTDFHLGDRIANRTDLLNSVGWSSNDLTMIGLWWFFDPDVYSVDKLNRLVSDFGTSVHSTLDISLISTWLIVIFRQDMVTVALLCLFSVVSSVWAGNRRIIFCLFLCFLSFVGMAILGREGVPRVVYSAIIVVLVMSIVRRISRVNGIALSLAAVLSTVISFGMLAEKAKGASSYRAKSLEIMSAVPSDEVVMVWGDSLPYETLYPALLRFGDTFPSHHLFSLGSDALAPYSLSWWGGDVRRLIAKIRSPEGVGLIAEARLLDNLGVYCREHWGSELIVRPVAHNSSWGYYRVACIGG